MMIRPKFDDNKQFETKAPVVSLGTLVVLKFIPKARPEKDGVDIISLLLDRSQDIDILDIVKKCTGENLTAHVLSQIQDFSKRLRVGDMEKVWSRVTGTPLTGIQARNVQSFLRELDRALRGR